MSATTMMVCEKGKLAFLSINCESSAVEELKTCSCNHVEGFTVCLRGGKARRRFNALACDGVESNDEFPEL